jgi:hypothetical protein
MGRQSAGLSSFSDTVATIVDDRAGGAGSSATGEAAGPPCGGALAERNVL